VASHPRCQRQPHRPSLRIQPADRLRWLTRYDGSRPAGLEDRPSISRWDVVELGRRATALAAVHMLDRLAERMPFAVRAISVDGGSEFMADFEIACQARGIALFVLPPRSPKLHGAVERANRTHTRGVLRGHRRATRAGRAAGTADLGTCYNTVRPHQALGYLTPAEWLAAHGFPPDRV